MPAAPELAWVSAQVRGSEVVGEPHAHHDAQTDRHVGVGGEVVVNVKTERVRGHPRFGAGEGAAFVEQVLDDRGQLVGDDHFLDHADREQVDAEADVVPGDAFAGELVQLRDELVAAHDRARDQVREHGDEHPKFQKRPGRLGVAAAHVDQVRDEFERVERDAQRQHDRGDDGIGGGRLEAGEQVQVVEHEQRVFEEGQVEHVEHDADPEHPAPARPDHQVDEAERDDRHGHEQDEKALRMGDVEERIGDGEQPQPLALEQQVRDEQRQEKQDEIRRIEEHAGTSRHEPFVVLVRLCRMLRWFVNSIAEFGAREKPGYGLRPCENSGFSPGMPIAAAGTSI